MKRLLALGALAVVLAASSGGAATRPWPGSASWADAKHGWAPNHDGLCRGKATALDRASLCATEDGGRTWGEIFVGGNFLLAALRTSVGAGIVSTGAHGHVEYWTRDNGRHWFGVEPAGLSTFLGAPPPLLAGRGGDLFYADGFRRDTVYRLTPWPPAGAAVCRGPWARSISEEDADTRGNVCLGPPVTAGSRSVPVVSVPGTLVSLRRVPDGVLALFESEDRTTLTAAVHRQGANVIRDLPPPSNAGAGAVASVQVIQVAWPAITIVGRYGGVGPAVSPTVEARWRSVDGGASWTVSTRRAWAQLGQNPVARAGAAAGALGDDIVLAGGAVSTLLAGPDGSAFSKSTVSRLVQAYRPADDSWRELAPLPAAVTRAAGTSSRDAFYVVGGFDRRGRPTRSAFALRNGSWQRLPPLPEPRGAAGAAILGGRLYVVGGIAARGLARRVLSLDLRSNRWSSLPGPRPRAYLGVAAGGGRVFALGGRLAGAETSLALVESWRPGDRSWHRQRPLPSRRSDTAAVGLNDRIVSIGGAATEFYRPLEAVNVLEFGVERWESLPGLVTPRYGHGAAAIGDTIYALVGGDGDGPDDRGTLVESLLVDR